MTDKKKTPASKKPAKSKPKKPAAKKPAAKKPAAKSAATVPVVSWAVSNIVLPKKWNRQEMEKTGLAELAASIKSKGQLVPLQVRTTDKPTKVELVEGRRRLAVLQDVANVAKAVAITAPNT